MDSVTRKHLVLENTRCCNFAACRGCGKVHLHFGPSTVTMRPEHFEEVMRQLQRLADEMRGAPAMLPSEDEGVILSGGRYVVA